MPLMTSGARWVTRSLRLSEYGSCRCPYFFDDYVLLTAACSFGPARVRISRWPRATVSGVRNWSSIGQETALEGNGRPRCDRASRRTCGRAARLRRRGPARPEAPVQRPALDEPAVAVIRPNGAQQAAKKDEVCSRSPTNTAAASRTSDMYSARERWAAKAASDCDAMNTPAGRPSTVIGAATSSTGAPATDAVRTVDATGGAASSPATAGLKSSSAPPGVSIRPDPPRPTTIAWPRASGCESQVRDREGAQGARPRALAGSKRVFVHLCGEIAGGALRVTRREVAQQRDRDAAEDKDDHEPLERREAPGRADAAKAGLTPRAHRGCHKPALVPDRRARRSQPSLPRRQPPPPPVTC